MEARREVKLLHRSTHAVSLTSEGAALLPVAQALLLQSVIVERTFAFLSPAGAAGEVRISAPVGFTRRRLAPLLVRLSAAHPDIRIDLRATNVFPDLAAEGIDVAIRGGSLDGSPAHLRRRWFEFTWITIASPRYLAARRAPERSSDLASHDLVGFRDPRTGRAERWRLREMAPSMPRFRLTCDDGNTAVRMVEAGLGIGHAPQWMVSESLRNGDLVELLTDERPPVEPMWMVRADHPSAPSRVRTVIEFLLAEYPFPAS